MRPILPSLLLAAAVAGQAGEAPLAELRIDGPLLVGHWAQTPYARLWADPVAKPLHARLAEALIAAQAAGGIDPLALLAALRVHGRLDALAAGPGGTPVGAFAVQADLGAQAPALFAMLMTSLGRELELTPIAIAGSGADAVHGNQHVTIARYGTLVVAGPGGRTPAPAPFPAATDDIAGTVDLDRLKSALLPLLPAEGRAALDANPALLATYRGRMTWRSRFVPEGSHEQFTTTAPQPFVRPIDRALLARLPANALIAGAMGIDGAAYWDLMRPGLTAPLRQMAELSGAPLSEEQVVAQFEEQLKQVGITATITDLAAGLTGTWLVAVTPGAPFPAVTLAMPRTPAIDQAVGVLLGMAGSALPADGAAASITVPNLGIPVQILRAAGHWVASSDPAVIAAWSAGQPGGWTATPAATLALAKAPADAYAIAAGDTPAVLRTLSGYAGLGLANLPGLQAAERNAILQGIAKLAALAGTDYVVAGTRDGLQVTEMRGLLGSGVSVAVVAIVAAIAVPNLIESRVAANENAAAASLKSGLFPAQVLFQGGACQDIDEDNVGEYALISELTGRRPTTAFAAGKLRYVQGALAQGDGDLANGYRYAAWLPDGAGGAIGEPAGLDKRPPLPKAADAQERRFILYAWPEKGEGTLMFAITEQGQLYALPWDGEKPAWDALFGGKGWDGAPAWPPHRR